MSEQQSNEQQSNEQSSSEQAVSKQSVHKQASNKQSVGKQSSRKKSTQSTVFKIVGSVVIAGVVLVAGLLGYWWSLLNEPITLAANKSTEISIAARTTVTGAVEQLSTQGLFPSPNAVLWAAKLYARWTDKGIQSGIFEFEPGMTQADVVTKLFTRASVVTISATFQEGITLKKFAEIAEEKLGVSQVAFLRLAYSDSLLKARNIKASSVEGYLMPNTYEFYKKSSAANVMDKFLDAQEEFWSDKTHAEQEKKRGLTRHEILSLASIVEAETPVDAEKKRVAGVYSNRLNIDMKLEADPTVQYALDLVQPKRENRRLLFRDLEINSAYNTYKNKGLPPGPINCPGKAAIEAAMDPEQHKFIYFVAAADGSNTHIFSQTAAEHLRAVAVFRARRARLQAQGK